MTRKGVVALLALALAATPALATDKPPPIAAPVVDRWSGEDKEWHAIAGAVVGTAATVKWQSRAVGFAAGCGTGVAFELLAPGFKSYKDAVVTCLGAAFGALIGGWHVQGQRNGLVARKEF